MSRESRCCAVFGSIFTLLTGQSFKSYHASLVKLLSITSKVIAGNSKIADIKKAITQNNENTVSGYAKI